MIYGHNVKVPMCIPSNFVSRCGLHFASSSTTRTSSCLGNYCIQALFSQASVSRSIFIRSRPWVRLFIYSRLNIHVRTRYLVPPFKVGKYSFRCVLLGKLIVLSFNFQACRIVTATYIRGFYRVIYGKDKANKYVNGIAVVQYGFQVSETVVIILWVVINFS